MLVCLMKKTKVIKPHYKNIHDWEFYSSNLMTEYQQSIEEGLDIEAYQDVFGAVSRLLDEVGFNESLQYGGMSALYVIAGEGKHGVCPLFRLSCM